MVSPGEDQEEPDRWRKRPVKAQYVNAARPRRVRPRAVTSVKYIDRVPEERRTTGNAIAECTQLGDRVHWVPLLDYPPSNSSTRSRAGISCHCLRPSRRRTGQKCSKLPRAARGRKRAIVAVAHSITIAVHHVLTDRVPFKDLGADFVDKLNRDGLQKYYVKRLRNLGLGVQLQQTSGESNAA